MKTKTLLIITGLFLSLSMAFAGESSAEADLIKAAKKAARKERAKEEWNAHFQFYGFAREYLTYDSRQGYAPDDGLYYFVPKDHNYNAYGDDLNATPEFRFLHITSRLGLNIHGYRYKNTEFGAKIETDFDFQVSTTAAVALRLRHFYFTMGWNDLDIAGGKKADLQLLMGQTWHPISTGYADLMSYETGSPFDVSNRSPQITFDATFDKKFNLQAALVVQFQYSSVGPDGRGVNYMRYGLTPEAFAAFTFKDKGFMARAGVNVLSIKPRKYGVDDAGVQVKVKDRITTFVPFAYFEYRNRSLLVNLKTSYGQAGEHINLMSGYGVSDMSDPAGSRIYTPLQSSSTWAYVQYGTKFIGAVFGGYFKNFGSIDPLVSTSKEYLYINNFCDPGLTQAWRIIPAFKVQLGKFLFGVEYHYTAAQYGDPASINDHGIATEGLHWVGNHRVLAMFQYAW